MLGRGDEQTLHHPNPAPAQAPGGPCHPRSGVHVEGARRRCSSVCRVACTPVPGYEINRFRDHRGPGRVGLPAIWRNRRRPLRSRAPGGRVSSGWELGGSWSSSLPIRGPRPVQPARDVATVLACEHHVAITLLCPHTTRRPGGYAPLLLSSCRIPATPRLDPGAALRRVDSILRGVGAFCRKGPRA